MSARYATSEAQMINDMGQGFGHFVDEILRGRRNNAIFNTSLGLSALDIGIPDDGVIDIPNMLLNNSKLYVEKFSLTDHPLFNFSAPTEAGQAGFTLFGLDFHDVWNQLTEGAPSIHHTPFYTPPLGEDDAAFKLGADGQSLAKSLYLPDLPYGEMAHFAHIGMAFYDTGRTFMDLWNDPALKHNVLKIITHPEVAHTLLHRGVMLTVMGLLHPLGMVVAIGVSYLCAHLVHSAFELLENNKDIVRQIEQVPVLREIYNATGIKEWAESSHRFSAPHGNGHNTHDAMNPLGEPMELRSDRQRGHNKSTVPPSPSPSHQLESPIATERLLPPQHILNSSA